MCFLVFIAARFVKFVRCFADGIGAHPHGVNGRAQPLFGMPNQPAANALTSRRFGDHQAHNLAANATRQTHIYDSRHTTDKTAVSLRSFWRVPQGAATPLA